MLNLIYHRRKTFAHIFLLIVMYLTIWRVGLKSLYLQLFFLILWFLITISPGIEYPSLNFSKTPSKNLKRIMAGVHQRISEYRPTFWIPDRHSQTIIPELVRSYLTTVPDIKYNREILLADDGGTLALDFVIPSSSTLTQDGSTVGDNIMINNKAYQQFLSETLVILYPGITGGSDAIYIKEVVQKLRSVERNLRIVCLNQRGVNCLLTSPMLSNASFTGDFHKIIQFLKNKLHYQYFIGIGYSMGANLLVKYLGQQGTELQGKFLGAISISNPLDLLKASHQLGSFISRNIYSRRLCQSALQFIKDSKQFEKINESSLGVNYEEVLRSERLIQLDERLTRKLSGYSSVEEYYLDGSSCRWIDKIAIPTLVINAKNDPFVDPSALSHDNDNVLLVTTENGGHLGFPEGCNLFHLNNWTHGIVVDFVKSVLNEQKVSLLR